MAKKKSKSTAPKTIWLYVPASKEGDPHKVAPTEFGQEHAMNLLNMPKNGGWKRWELDKTTSDAAIDSGNKGNPIEADSSQEDNS